MTRVKEPRSNGSRQSWCCGEADKASNPYATTDWGRTYRQRNRIESFNAAIRYNTGNMAERSWTRVFGRCKVGLFLWFKVLAVNVRSIANFLHERQ